MIRAIVVDDERPAVERLVKMLAVFPDVSMVGEAHDGIEALEVIEMRRPDVVFLDIDMPELGGLEVAKTLGVTGPRIVFVTAHDEHALEAFESFAIDYLVKPVNSGRLERTIEKLRQSRAQAGSGAGTGTETTSGHLSAATLSSVVAKLASASRPARLAVKLGTRYEVFDPALISAAVATDRNRDAAAGALG